MKGEPEKPNEEEVSRKEEQQKREHGGAGSLLPSWGKTQVQN